MYALGVSIAMITSLLTRWEIGNLIRVDSYYQDEGFSLAWSMTKLLVYVEVIVLILVTITSHFLGLSKEICYVIFLSGFFGAIDKFGNLLRCDLEGKMQFKQNFKVKIIFTPIVALITIPMAVMGFGVWALLSSVWVGPLINWVVFRKVNPRKLPMGLIKFIELKKIIKPSFWQWMCFCGQTLFVRADKLAVGAVASETEVGFYNRAFNFAPISFLGLGALAGGPAIVIFSKDLEVKSLWEIYFKRAAILIGSGILFGSAWLLWGEFLVGLIFGENWLPAVPYFQAFAMFGAVKGLYYLTTALMQGKKLYQCQALINFSILGVVAIVGLFALRDGLSFVYLLQVAMLASSIVMLLYTRWYLKRDDLVNK